MIRERYAEDAILNPDFPLDSVSLYHYELRESGPRLSDEQETLLIEQARTGDKKARSALAASLFHAVCGIASRYARAYDAYTDYLDLIQIGNLAILERMEHALSHEAPCAYLMATAKYSMMNWCLYSGYPMKTASYQKGMQVESLDAPLTAISSDHDVNLLEVLSCPYQAQELEDVLQEEPQEDVHQSLYQAVEALPPQQRNVIQRYFGLDGYAHESLLTIDRNMLTVHKTSTSFKRSAAYGAKCKALASLHALLTGSGKKRVRWSPERDTPDAVQRMDEAYAHLQARGEPITIKTLKKEAHVQSDRAGEYLRQRRAGGVTA